MWSLTVRSNYSFLEGASHPEELVSEARRLGLRGIALVDRDGVYGIVRAHKQAKQCGLSLIVGSTLTVDDGTEIVLLAPDAKGYATLCGLISKGRLRSAKGRSQVTWEEVYNAGADTLALWGAGRAAIAAPHCDPRIADGLREAFGDRLYALVSRHRQVADVDREAVTRQRAAAWALPVVGAHDVLYHTPARRELQDVLTCIRHGVTLRDAGQRIHPNAEFCLKTPHALEALFADDPQALHRASEVGERCTFSLDDLRYRYPSEALPDGRTTGQWLEELTLEGAFERYGGPPSAEVAAQLRKELDLIAELDYAGYFLTMHEIVRFCRARGILCQGRGSAANSSVCYCLGITAVDPVRLGLLFERFLSRERAEPPDIDLDIAHERREEVIQHVYEKYGRAHAAMVANVIRYRSKSAIRDVGKVLGIPETGLDRLAKMLSHNAQATPETFTTAGLAPDSPANAHLLRLAREIQDFPRHLSIHPGGFLLGHRPVHELVPIENASMEGRTVVQWDKYDVEELGLFKVDLLGLGALTMVDACFRLLKQYHGLELDMASLPPDDPETFDMICDADTVGTFQIESRAQMNMLPRLRPRSFYDLVIEISIVRPGPIAGDMVHPYLRRRNGEEPITYPHPSLMPVLEKTLGVPLFQEQVMRLAVVAADYTPGEADQLRRDMAAWRSKGKIEQHHARITSRMIDKGIEPAFAERVFEQIRGFGEYGFPESHAASFALISYATCYLRCHYLSVFVCALLNAQPMGFYSPATILEDARRKGLEIRPIDLTCSAWDCTCEPIDAPPDARGLQPLALRLGLRYVRGLRREAAELLLAAREHQPFSDVQDVVQRTEIDRGSLERIADAGALRSLEGARRDAVWQVLGWTKERGQTLALKNAAKEPTFDTLEAFDEIAWDYRTTATSALGHPLATLRTQLDALRLPDAERIRGMRDGKRTRYAGIVICRQRPGTASGVVFMTLEDETGFVNLVIWPTIFEKFGPLVRTTSFLGVTGKVQSKEGVVHLVAEQFWIPKLPEAPKPMRSRDFH